MQRITKDPDSNRWYTVPWKNALLGTALAVVKISSVDFQVPVGLTKEAEGFTDNTASVKLSGGTLAAEYTVVSRIVTDDSQTMDFSFLVLIRAQ